MHNIRNFSIIAHIDHGKSTLADRMLEMTGTIEKRNMRDQVLDSMDLERERGITIKMQPARMLWRPTINGQPSTEDCILNLIDTPGHIDFSYEVSRSLKAVEGSILLIDSTQGVQAQTLTTLTMAREMGLVIIPVLSKIDSPLARIDEVTAEVTELLGCDQDAILKVSGKTGEGVRELLDAIIERVPPPHFAGVSSDRVPSNARLAEHGAAAATESIPDFAKARPGTRALVFDYAYSNHQGIIVYARVFEGVIKKSDQLLFRVTGERFIVQEVGVFVPEQKQKSELMAGEIGYIVTGIKKPDVAAVGDTVTEVRNPRPALPGYMQPAPVVWASIYTQSQDDFDTLRAALHRLKLSDSSLSFEEESSLTLGRGFRCGFLGMLHLEIVAERLRREHGLELIITSPSIVYEVDYASSPRTHEKIYSPARFPDHGNYAAAYEPWAKITLFTPGRYVGDIMKLLYEHEALAGDSQTFGGDRMSLEAEMPLREMMRNFFDQLKSVTSGYASFSYEIIGMREADVVRLDILVAEEPVAAFCQVISKRKVQEEAERIVERLHSVLPRQLFVIKIQGKAMGRILSSRTLSALKKTLGDFGKNGGDVTRKMKLWKKQKEGKKRLQSRAKVDIPQDVFLKMIKME